jgi:pimeloyl-ACP methyl ester carboxylesterase
VTPLRAYTGPRLSLISAANEIPSALHALGPDLPHRKVDGVGHWIQLDAPEAVNEALDQFLAQHSL